MSQILNSWVEGLSRKSFNWVHQNNLVYNQCWEDPRLDRVALNLTPNDHILMLTSAGCNALDYLLQNPASITAIDVNPHQSALLELKVAGIQKLSFSEFFDIFGKGRSRFFKEVYQEVLRSELTPASQKVWDSRMHYFSNQFYFKGTSGFFARAAKKYIDIKGVRNFIELMFFANSTEEQKELYQKHIRDVFWPKWFNKVLEMDLTLSLLGVPLNQKKHVARQYEGGMSKFMQDCVESVFTRLPLADNYFWWLYFSGSYLPERCPEYLKKENFLELKNLTSKLKIETGRLDEYLENTTQKFSRYVLLDHMDWMTPVAIEREWNGIVDRAMPQARVLFRSGSMQVDFVDPVQVMIKGKRTRLGDVLNYDHQLASELHKKDRVHTYGSFSIATLKDAGSFA